MVRKTGVVNFERKPERGAKMRMRDWMAGQSHLRGSTGEEWYDVVLYKSLLYLCLKSHTASSANNPQTSVANNLGYWEKAQDWTFVATKLMLAERIKAEDIDADNLVAKNVDIEGIITASSGHIGGWKILADGIESEELSQSNNGVTGKSKTILKKDGTILGNLLNVTLGGGTIRSSLWDAPIIEWGDRVVKIRGILSTPFELISAIIQPSGNPYFGNVYTTNLADKTNCILLEPSYPSSGTSNNYASKVYYRLPANINHSGVTFRFFNPATRTQGWRACTAVLGYNISLADSASWIGSSGKTPFLGNCMADELLIPPGKMVVITGVREQADGGSFGDDKLKWYVEVTA